MGNSNTTKRFIDLGHTVEHGLVTYKGLPAPIISDHMSREESKAVYAHGTEFHIGRINMIGNTGTYVDAPFHRYAHGKDLSELPLESLAELPGILIDGSSTAPNDIDLFEGKDLAGKAVLIHTGWSRHWLTEKYFENPPFLTRKAAEFLVQSRAALVGIDSMNIDDIDNKSRPVHTVLLNANIPIAEHLTNLDQLPHQGFRFFAVPIKVKSFGTFPVRAFAVIP